ncbi:DUF2550 domain-containing protein [Dactylosporangium sp. CA-092794]|uniref:DUF2550 domain-containing protein n=1 Tax=Dactylosporangium sp. CA-092794 TaxID=3239929 RepID=UPI003D8A4462
MRIVEGIGIGVLVLLAALAVLFLRRLVIARRGGTIELGVRLSTFLPGRGWSAGLARFAGDELRWYRIFSFWPGPRRVFSRRGLAVERRRSPDPAELLVLPQDWVIVRCVSRQAPVEIAMAERALTGFLSWVEAAPPGDPTPETRPYRYRAS